MPYPVIELETFHKNAYPKIHEIEFMLFYLVHVTQFYTFPQSGTFEKCLENVKLRKKPV